VVDNHSTSDGYSDPDEIRIGTDPMNPGDYSVLGQRPVVVAAVGIVSTAGVSAGIIAAVRIKKKRARNP